MTVIGWIQILLYCLIIIAVTPLLGAYMTRVFSGERTFLSPVLRPVEFVIYKLAGVSERSEQHAVDLHDCDAAVSRWRRSLLYALMRLQAAPPFNPADKRRSPGDLSSNTAVSFITNTNWQKLRRRKHDVLSRADAGAHASELSVGGHRHRARRRADPRFRATLGPDRREFLGRCDALHALRPYSQYACPTRCS